jgi:hypothetical protein
MKPTFPLLFALVLAGCAAEEAQDKSLQMANADCKVLPATTDSSTGNPPKHVTEMQQKFAEADLASSSYRFRNLQVNGQANNNVEDALRKCSQ